MSTQTLRDKAMQDVMTDYVPSPDVLNGYAKKDDLVGLAKITDLAPFTDANEVTSAIAAAKPGIVADSLAVLAANDGASKIGHPSGTVESAIIAVEQRVTTVETGLSGHAAQITSLSTGLASKESTESVNTKIAGVNSTIASLTKANVGLGNVDNTSDLDKPVSNAVHTALNAKANTDTVNTALASKADTSAMNTALALKADSTEVNTALATKAALAGLATQDFAAKNLSVSSVNTGPLAGLRNYLINGCMRVAQRGTSFTIPPNSGAYTLDRWTIWNGTNATLVVQIATVGNYNGSDMTSRMRLAMQTAPTTGTVFVTQRIEGVHTLAGKEVVASATFLSEEATMQTRFTLGQYFGVNGSPTVMQYGAFMAPASSAMQASVSKLTLPSIVGKTIGANNTLDFTFELLPRTTLGHTLTEVQLEQGPIVTPFERRPIALELLLCHRYYRRWAVTSGFISIGAGFSYSTTGTGISLTVGEMRKVPIIGWSNCGVYSASGAQIAATNINYGNFVGGQAHLTITTAGGTTVGQGNQMCVGRNDGQPGYFELDAEIY